jgi:DNA-binding LacI/PurR family transcriptional regulator
MIQAPEPGPRRGKATIEEVARAAGVSRQTVSNALNAPQRVRDATLARVMDAIEQLGYQPDSSARSLRTGERRAIGYLTPADDPFDPNPLMGGFLEALVDAAGAEGFRVLLFRPAPGARDARAVLDEVIAARQVDGFVLSDVLEGDARVEHVVRAGVPFVTFGRLSPSWVDVDNAAAVEAVVEHLAGLGHRRVVYLGSETGLPWMRERLAGFRRAAAEAGIEAREAIAPLDDPAGAVAVAREALDVGSTAIVAESDSLALAAYEAVRSEGLAVGADVAVTGFGDAPVARVLHPGLTSVRLPLRTIAGEIVRRLVAQVRGVAVAEQGLSLDAELVVRESSGSIGPAI